MCLAEAHRASPFVGAGSVIQIVPTLSRHRPQIDDWTILSDAASHYKPFLLKRPPPGGDGLLRNLSADQDSCVNRQES